MVASAVLQEIIIQGMQSYLLILPYQNVKELGRTQQFSLSTNYIKIGLYSCRLFYITKKFKAKATNNNAFKLFMNMFHSDFDDWNFGLSSIEGCWKLQLPPLAYLFSKLIYPQRSLRPIAVSAMH